MDKLVLERTQPVQGQRVDVAMLWNDESLGEISFDFHAWLKFKRLLEKGLELDARENHGLDLKLIVKGRDGVAGFRSKPYINDTAEPAPRRTEDDDFYEDMAAIEAAEAGAMPPTASMEEHQAEAQSEADAVTQGLIRTLRRENA
jgi:hypothetical protein